MGQDTVVSPEFNRQISEKVAQCGPPFLLPGREAAGTLACHASCLYRIPYPTHKMRENLEPALDQGRSSGNLPPQQHAISGTRACR